MEQNVVPADREAGRGQLAQTLRIAGHVEDPSAAAFLQTKKQVGRVMASLKAGELTITLTLRADGRYTHELRSSRPAEPPYSEVGTWDLDSSSAVIAGKPKSKPASTIDGFRIRRLTRDDRVLRKDFVGEREGSFEVLRLERVR
jgi:hypothetical protein